MSKTDEKFEKYAFTLLRVALGWTFLFAFLDKGFGRFVFEYSGTSFGTQSDDAWINGGDPTWGFLVFGTKGKFFEGTFSDMAGSDIVIFLFMFGLLGVGLAMILGIGRKIAAVTGALMMVILWFASIPLVHNPFMDEHLIYALILLILGFTKHHGIIFLPQWGELEIVKKYSILQ